MNKLVKIYSHPRSGTNFLCALLKKNFYKERDLSTLGKWGHWSERQTFNQPVSHGGLFGHHGYIRNIVDNTTQDRRIYIYRDGRDVAVSLWKTKQFLNHSMRKITFSDFLRTNLDWIYTPGNKCPPGQNIIQHWYSHVSCCVGDYKKTYFIVSFEELVSNTQLLLQKVSQRLGLVQDGRFLDPKSLVGPAPNTGIVGNWREYFTQEDLEYFYKFVPRGSPYLFDGV